MCTNCLTILASDGVENNNVEANKLPNKSAFTFFILCKINY